MTETVGAWSRSDDFRRLVHPNARPRGTHALPSMGAQGYGRAGVLQQRWRAAFFLQATNFRTMVEALQSRIRLYFRRIAMNDELSRSVVKAQNAAAIAAWDV